MDKTKTFLITILVVLLFGIPITIGKSQIHILVIHSDSADSTSAKEINRGMEMYRNDNLDFANKVIIEHYYLDMDNRNRQKCEIYLTEIQNTKNFISDQKPDLVILSGDMAQRLIGILLVTPQSSNKSYLKNNVKWLSEHGGCAKNDDTKKTLSIQAAPIILNYPLKIVFTGVTTADVQEYGYSESPAMAGTYQHLFIPAVKNTIEDLYNAIPGGTDVKPTGIIVIGDPTSIASPSIQKLKTELAKKNAFDVPLQWSGLQKASKWEDWQKLIQAAEASDSIFFITGYSDLISGELTGKEIVQWTEACSKFPVLGSVDSFIADGGMLSITMSDQEQGVTALYLASQLLKENGQPESIAFKEAKQFRIGMNKSLLEDRQINLPFIYESFSRESDNFQDESSHLPDCQ